MSPRTKEQNAEIKLQSRNLILDAAFEMFAQVGFDRTSMSAIAKEAGVSKGLIYHHFDSKEDVLKGVFDSMVERTQSLWQEGLENATPRQILSSVIDITVQFLQKYPGWVRLMVHLALQEDVVEGLREHIEVLRKQKAFQVKPLFEALGYEDPLKEAFYFGAKLDGITLGWLSLGADYPIDDMIQQLKLEYKLNENESH